MKIIGITGGIGSGKTTVCKIFEVLKIPVFYADVEAKKLLSLPDIQLQLHQIFGEEIFENQEINKKALANIVFSHKHKLNQLNSVIHPAVAEKFNLWASLQKSDYVLKEAAILFESGGNEQVKKVIYVSAPENLRIDRVCLRDGVTAQEVKQRIANQWPEERKIQLSDYQIINDEKSELIPQIMQLHNTIINETF